MTDPNYVPHLPIILARIIQDAFGLAALALLPVVARYGLRDAAGRQPATDEPVRVPATTAGAR
jgi:hypothetical protein